MDTKKRTRLVEDILNHGKTIAEDCGSVFALEWIVVAAGEICMENRQETLAEAEEEYRNEVHETVSAFVAQEFSIFSCKNLAQDLKADPPGPGAQILVQLALTSAAREADVLSADVLIRWILEHPTERMRGISDEPPGEEKAEEKGSFDISKMIQAAKAGMGKAEPADADFGEPEESTSDDMSEVVVEKVRAEDFFPELTAQIRMLRTELSSQIFGQEHAIHTFLSGYFQSRVIARTNPMHKGPAASFLFAGAPGVGKTLLAEKAAELLGMPWCRFDMSEYSERDGVWDYAVPRRCIRMPLPVN